MEWVHMILALCCLGGGLLHLVRLFLLRGDRLGEASHAAMGFGMAAMFSPLGDPVPAVVWIVVFVVTGAWFTGLALRSGLGTRDAAYHVVGAGAMLFMLLAGSRDAAGGHSHGADGLGIASVLVLALAGFFTWHALRCGDRLIAAARGEAGADCDCAPEGGTDAAQPVATGASTPLVALAAAPATGRAPAAAGRFAGIRSVRTGTALHIGMAGAMTVMFLPML